MNECTFEMVPGLVGRIAELLEGYRQYHMEMTRNYPDQAEKYRALR